MSFRKEIRLKKKKKKKDMQVANGHMKRCPTSLITAAAAAAAKLLQSCPTLCDPIAGIKPKSSALEGGFLASGLPGEFFPSFTRTFTSCGP